MFFLPRLCPYILGSAWRASERVHPQVICHFHLMSAAFKFQNFHAGSVDESVTLGLLCEDRPSVGELWSGSTKKEGLFVRCESQILLYWSGPLMLRRRCWGLHVALADELWFYSVTYIKRWENMRVVAGPSRFWASNFVIVGTVGKTDDFGNDCYFSCFKLTCCHPSFEEQLRPCLLKSLLVFQLE